MLAKVNSPRLTIKKCLPPRKTVLAKIKGVIKRQLVVIARSVGKQQGPY
jgi:hypothetical protein